MRRIAKSSRDKLNNNMKGMLVVFVVMFMAIIGYLSYSVITFGEEWYKTPYNPRLQKILSDVTEGAIYDREGEKLAWSEEVGERSYIDSASARRALSHVLGDTSGMSVGAEAVFTGYLYGIEDGSADAGAKKGNDITLTVSSKLSRYIYAQLDGRQGCVVVMNYKTGEVLANVALPAFDPETVAVDELPEGALLDRAVMGRYPPGSIMKIVTASAAVEQGIDIEYKCTGEDIIDGQKVTCVSKHGKLNLEKAVMKSCNCYFAHLSNEIGAEELLNKAEDFGFNYEWDFDDTVLYKSNFEVSDEAGDIAWAGIGQYNDLITPMHACMMAASIANDGEMMEPKLLLRSTNENGRVTYSIDERRFTRTVSSRTAQIITDYMKTVVSEGTGTSAAVSGLDVAGKTGTAEYVDEETGEVKNHSWFVGFIDEAETPYAVSVIVEGAGYGSKHAAPLAGKVLEFAAENL